MKVEIYGIPSTVHNCIACRKAVELLEENNIEYVFYPVLNTADNDLGFGYDRDRINELAKRLNTRGLAFTYPKIFVDGNYIGGYMNLEKLFD